jgi:hypothetical protein
MTIDDFDQCLANLLKLVLPPSVSDDPPVVADQVIKVLEDHLAAVRDTIVRHKIETTHAE